MADEAARPEGPARALARAALGRLPFAVGITGPVRDRLLVGLDGVFGAKAGHLLANVAPGRALNVDLAQPNQRLLSYLYPNVLRHYRRTALYATMRGLAADLPRAGFLDVGANLGIYCLLAGRLGWRAVAVEPEPHHAMFLRRNPWLHSRVLEVALSDAEGQATFYVARDDNPGASSLELGGATLQEVGIYQETVKVPLRTLEAIEGEVPERLALIKVDVEGHEARAVAGMVPWLAARRPSVRPALWCEVRGPQSGRAPSSHREVCHALEPLGYRPYLVDRDGTRHAFEAGGQPPQVFDLLFVP